MLHLENFFEKYFALLLTTPQGKVSRNFNFTMSYRYDILSKTTLCTAVFYTVQTEQAMPFGIENIYPKAWGRAAGSGSGYGM